MREVSDKVFVIAVLVVMLSSSLLFLYVASQTTELSEQAKERIEKHRQHLED